MTSGLHTAALANGCPACDTDITDEAEPTLSIVEWVPHHLRAEDGHNVLLAIFCMEHGRVVLRAGLAAIGAEGNIPSSPVADKDKRNSPG